jgi:hypothetical protein
MTAWGGAPRLNKAQLDAGRAAGLAKRRAVKEAGMIAARDWRDAHHPTPARGHMPFAGHRTCAEVAADEARESRIERLQREFRSDPR